MLRGINVSGKNIIKMDALKELCVKLGFKDVVTYIQSGNVVFRSNLTSDKLETRIQEAIKEKFGFDVPVMVLKKEELEDILKSNPFLSSADKDEKFIHFTILSAVPEIELVKSIDRDRYLPDEFICIGRAVYLYCPVGYGNTKLNNSLFEKKLKLKATTRNLNTIRVLYGMMN